MPDFWVIAGGLLIGLSASVLLMFNGRVAGISGLLWSSLKSPSNKDWSAVAFIVGLPAGTLLFHATTGEAMPNNDGSWLMAVIGGALVGFGVKLGSGCTSGHGVCGIGRFSFRSLVATLCFMASGIITVYVLRHLL